MKEEFKETEIGLIPEDWELVTLNKICNILMGQSPPSKFYNTENKGLPFFQGRKDFGDKYPTVTMWCSEPKRIAKGADVLLSVRAPVGDINVAKERCCIGRGLSSISMKNNNNEFLYYLIQYYKPRLKDIFESEGTVFGCITKKGLHDFEVAVPPEDEQLEISKILSDLDKKIELNQKMNQTLEKIGQTIFKHWFVDFEFPDENGRPYKSSGGEMEDCEFGEIPKSWEVGTIDDLCDSITNGGTPKRKEETYWKNGNIVWYKTGELFDDPLIESEEHITEEGLKNSACKLWKPNTILIALYASPTVGRLGILKTPATSNQACSGLVAKNEVGYQYLFYTLLFKRNEFNSIAVGSAQQNISQDIVKNSKTLIPDSKPTIEFQKIIEPLFEKRTLLVKESKNLSKIRDSLLPKLMSGKIRLTNSNQKLSKELEA